MSKPDWKDSPEWANWLAQDKDGGWFWFVYKPVLTDTNWYDPNETHAYTGNVSGSRSWKKSLEPRP